MKYVDAGCKLVYINGLVLFICGSCLLYLLKCFIGYVGYEYLYSIVNFLIKSKIYI